MERITPFDRQRLQLLERLDSLDLGRPLPEDFRKGFLKLMELAAFSLMHKEDNFFGNCMIQMKRGIRLDLPTAAGVTAEVASFNLYFNPLILLRYNLEEIKAVIKHQVYHIMFRHLERAEKLKKGISPLALNTGMDLAINQFIQDLPGDEMTLERAEGEYRVKLERDQPFEVYARLIQQCLDRPRDREGQEKVTGSSSPGEGGEECREDRDRPGGEPGEPAPGAPSPSPVPQGPQGAREDEARIPPDPGPGMERERGEAGGGEEEGEAGAPPESLPAGDGSPPLTLEREHRQDSCHDIWQESCREANLDNLKDLTRRMANQANRGVMPGELEEVLRELNRRPELKWQDILRKTVGTLPVPYKKTITRKDRRQPERLELRGRLSDRVIKITVALDTSASMGERELQKCMAELFSIARLYRHEITVIECGNKIEKVYRVRNPREVQYNLQGRGGTAFSPVFQYIHQKRLRDHLLVYFTDGMGEEELTHRPINYRTLWVLTGNANRLSLSRPYGPVKKLQGRG